MQGQEFAKYYFDTKFNNQKPHENDYFPLTSQIRNVLLSYKLALNKFKGLIPVSHNFAKMLEPTEEHPQPYRSLIHYNKRKIDKKD